jgi:prepilin-type N-terminal cleavage/methylation domain-containing protein
MLNINKKLSKKGFSLIELMVAVAILAMAIFGIFHAYSVGFMGMADARDRTVASNYMREIMEDIKNADFEKIEEKAGSGAVTISGKTFTKVVTVEPSTNLKKVSTIIYWDNYTKSVQSDMLIHFMQTTAGDPTRIMLFANPYKITPSTGTTNSASTITAIVKDKKGNNINSWSGDIIFSITYTSGTSSSDYGSFSTTSYLITTTINTSNGQASVNYIAPESEVDIIIEASAIDLSPDSVNITVTAGAVKIALSVPDNNNILAPGTNTIITAELVDADNNLITNTSADITFSVSGPGNLTSPTTKPTYLGTVNIDLSTSSTPGTITVIASSPNLDPGMINIITGGIIDITSTSNSIPIGEGVGMTVTIKDLNGIPINYNGIISLLSDVSEGVLGGFLDIQDNQVVYDGTTSSNVVSYAVNNSSSTGTVTITASDPDVILNSDSISFNITQALIPDHIMVTADPQNMEADGESTSEITAIVKTKNNRTVESYQYNIYFEISNGELGSISFGPFTPISGKVENVLLLSSGMTGVATITATSTDENNANNLISGFTEVGFYSDADHIDLIANPPSILKGGGEDGTTAITAIVKDINSIPVDNFTGTITFSIISGYPNGVNFTETNKGSLIVPVENSSTATVDLESKNWTGTAIIKAIASDGIFINLSNNIDIQVLNNVELNLSEGTIGYDSTNNLVSFDIEVLGADINLVEMQVLWVTDESLNKIEIKSPNTADAEIIFNNTETPALSGEIIDVGDIILSTGVSNVKIYFNQDMFGKTITVIFNPNSGNYSVTVPAPET